LTRFVFDTSPLSAFAQADAIEILHSIVDQHECLIPLAVREELARGKIERRLLAVPWLTTVHVDELQALLLFVQVKNRLGEGDRDVGEAAVLAYAGSHGACAVIDDLAARNTADAFGIRRTGTIGLLARGLRDRLISSEVAGSLVDTMRGRGVRLPCTGSGFVAFCRDHGLL